MYRVAAIVGLCWMATGSAAAAAWTEVRTPHYLLLGDAARGDMKRIAQRFEQFHRLMEQVLSRPSVSFATPTVVLVFRDQRSLRSYMPLYQGKPMDRLGVTAGDGFINYVAVTADAGSQTYPIVFRGLTHLITANVSKVSATWFQSAVGEYYSSFEVKDETEVLLGIPITAHAMLLREQFMPLRELLAIDRSSAAYNDNRRAAVFQAASWALLHYLRFSPHTRERFDAFVRLAEDGVPQEQALAKAFGVTLEKLEADLRVYVQRFSMLAERRTLKAPVGDADIRISEIPEGDVLPYLTGLQAAVGRVEEAQPRLEKAAADLSSSAAIHALLALVRLRDGGCSDAMATLRRDVSYTKFLDHYLTAAVHARCLSGQRNRDATNVDALRAHAQAATAARADVPEAWRQLALAHLLADEPKEAQAAIERALELAPANEYYHFTHAEVLVRQKEFVRARSILGSLMARGRSNEIRAEARRVMGSVVTYEQALQKNAGPVAAAAPQADQIARVDHGPSESAGSAPAAPGLIPVFRKVEPGETRVFATLTEIACGKDGVALVLHRDGAPLRVAAASFDKIEFISHRRDITGRVECGVRPEPEPAYVTWAGPETTSGSVKATSVVVELTPKGYTPQ